MSRLLLQYHGAMKFAKPAAWRARHFGGLLDGRTPTNIMARCHGIMMITMRGRQYSISRRAMSVSLAIGERRGRRNLTGVVMMHIDVKTVYCRHEKKSAMPIYMNTDDA